MVPNISTDPDHGIGGWTLAELASALKRGVSPEGANYYPAFPYTTYTRMELRDIADLKAFLDTLPASSRANEPHELPFPFNLRAALGPWKALNLTDAWVYADPPDPEAVKGRYLVEALGHCAECHTPRNPIGGLDLGRWMGGAPNPSGKGRIPNLTPAALDWSAADIAYYLKTGFTPDFEFRRGRDGRGDHQLGASRRRRPCRDRRLRQGAAAGRATADACALKWSVNKSAQRAGRQAQGRPLGVGATALSPKWTVVPRCGI